MALRGPGWPTGQRGAARAEQGVRLGFWAEEEEGSASGPSWLERQGGNADDAGRTVSAGRACGRGEAGCGPQGRVGRAELREKRGSWAGLGWTARVGWVSGFGFSFHYSFSISIFPFQTSSNQQLFEFKNNLNSNLCTQTNKRDSPA